LKKLNILGQIEEDVEPNTTQQKLKSIAFNTNTNILSNPIENENATDSNQICLNDDVILTNTNVKNKKNKKLEAKKDKPFLTITLSEDEPSNSIEDIHLFSDSDSNSSGSRYNRKRNRKSENRRSVEQVQEDFHEWKCKKCEVTTFNNKDNSNLFSQKETYSLISYLRKARMCFDSLKIPSRIDEKMQSEISRFNYNLRTFLSRVPGISIEEAGRITDNI